MAKILKPNGVDSETYVSPVPKSIEALSRKVMFFNKTGRNICVEHFNGEVEIVRPSNIYRPWTVDEGNAYGVDESWSGLAIITLVKETLDDSPASINNTSRSIVFIDEQEFRDRTTYCSTVGSNVLVYFESNGNTRMHPCSTKFNLPVMEAGTQGIKVVAEIPLGSELADTELYVVGGFFQESHKIIPHESESVVESDVRINVYYCSPTVTEDGDETQNIKMLLSQEFNIISTGFMHINHGKNVNTQVLLTIGRNKIVAESEHRNELQRRLSELVGRANAAELKNIERQHNIEINELNLKIKDLTNINVQQEIELSKYRAEYKLESDNMKTEVDRLKAEADVEKTKASITIAEKGAEKASSAASGASSKASGDAWKAAAGVGAAVLGLAGIGYTVLTLSNPLTGLLIHGAMFTSGSTFLSKLPTFGGAGVIMGTLHAIGGTLLALCTGIISTVGGAICACFNIL